MTATVSVEGQPYGVAYDSGNGYLYVANYISNTVSVINSPTNTVLATVPVVSYPTGVSYDSGNGEIYVANVGSDVVSVISGATNTVVATVTVGANPYGVVYDSGNGNVYAMDENSDQVSVISGATNTVVDTISLVAAPFDAAYDGANDQVYVTEANVDKVSVISGGSNTVLGSINVGGYPLGIAFDPQVGEVYVTNAATDNVSVIAASSDTVVATVSVGASPYGAGYDEGNGDVYVEDQVGDTVSVLSGTSEFVVATIGVGSAPTAATFDSGNGEVYVTDQLSNTVTEISTLLEVCPLGPVLRGEPSAGSVTGSVGVGLTPSLLAYDPGNGDDYVSNSAANTVSVISGATNAVVATIPVGTDPNGVVYDGGDGEVFVTNHGSNNVSVISDVTNGAVASIPVGAGPYGVAYDTGNGDVYVGNQGTDSVSVISAATNTVVATVSGVTTPVGVAYDSTNGDVYVGSYGASTVDVISGTTNQVVATTGFLSGVQGVAYDSGNQKVYVADSTADSVSVIDGVTNQVVATISVGAAPEALAYDTGNGEVYVTNSATTTVSVISSSTNEVVATVLVGTPPFGVAYDNGNGAVYVTNNGANAVSVISTLLAPTISPPASMDVGQSILLSASLLGQGTGGDLLLVSPSPSTGLDCSVDPPGYAFLTAACGAVVAGSYTVTMSLVDSIGNQVSTSMVLTVVSDPSATAPSSTRAAADVGQTVLFSTSPTGGTGAYAQYTWTSPAALGCATSTSNTLTCVPTAPAAFGTVSVDVTDSNNFTSVAAGTTFTVSPDPTISAPSASPARLDLGQGATSLSVVAVVGAGLGATYSWLGLPSGCLSGNSASLSCAPAASGTFSVSASVLDSNGFNVSSGALSLVVSPSLGAPGLAASVASLDVNQTVVFSATASGGTGTYSYSWTNLPSGCALADIASITCIPDYAAGGSTYTVSVTVTDRNGASATSVGVTITVYSDVVVLTASASPSSLDVGQSTSLAAGYYGGNGVYTWSWSGLPAGCLSTDFPTVSPCTPTASGVYAVQMWVEDSNGFNATGPALTLVVSPAIGVPGLTASRSVLDVGQTVVFTSSPSGGTGSYSYAWAGLPSGCSTADTAVLVCVPTSPGLGPVSTKVTVTDTNGASAASKLVSVTVDSDPTIATPAASTSTLDVGQTATLSIPSASGASPTVLSWSGLPKGCLSSNLMLLACTPTVAGTYTIVTSELDGNGWNVSSGPLTLLVAPGLGSASLAVSRAALDVGQTVVLTLSDTGGSGGYAYAWTGLPAGCPGANVASLACLPTQAGTYTLHGWVNDSNGASSHAGVLLTVSPALAVTSLIASVDRADVGQWVNYTVTASGGSGSLVYSWAGLPAGCSSTGTTASCHASASGQGTVSVVVSDGNGGAATSSSLPFTVYSDPGVGAPVASRAALDVGQIVVLQVNPTGGSGGFLYAWAGLPQGCSSVEALVVTCWPSAAGSTSVWVEVEDSDGYSVASASTSLTVSPVLSPGGLTVSDTEIDQGQSVHLTASVYGGSGTYTYTWDLPASCASANAPKVSCAPSSNGTFEIWATVTDTNGASVEVGPVALYVASPLLAPAIGASTSTIDVGSVVVYYAEPSGGTGPLLYSWTGLPTGCVSADSPTLTCVPTAVGTFGVTVTVTDAAGVTVTSVIETTNVVAAPSTSSSSPSAIDYAGLGLGIVALLAAIVALMLASRKKGGFTPEAAGTGSGRASREEEGPTPKTDALSEEGSAKGKDGSEEGGTKDME